MLSLRTQHLDQKFRVGSRMTFTFEPTASGARFTGVTRFASLESMEQLVKMGMIEGMRSAMGQLDAVLAGR